MLASSIFTCMCFLGFIRYNKTFIACGFRKYENLFTHEYHIPLVRCSQRIWYSWVNKCSYFPHHHAINVYTFMVNHFVEALWSWRTCPNYPFHMLPVELWEPNCKFSSLPVDIKSQKGQSWDNYIIMLFNSKYKRQWIQFAISQQDKTQ